MRLHVYFLTFKFEVLGASFKIGRFWCLEFETWDLYDGIRAMHLITKFYKLSANLIQLEFILFYFFGGT